MAHKESLFAGLHILMPAIPDCPADAGRRLHRYRYRESRCQVRTGWQKLWALCGYKSVKICVNPWFMKYSSCPCVFVAKKNADCPRFSTFVEDSLQISSFYAKQTQFP
jgi:hypothetical protein